MKKKQKVIVTLIAAVLITLFLFFNQLVNMITDYQWFKDLGYASVFTQKMANQLKIAVPVFILFFLISYFYLRSLKKNYYDKIQSYHISVSEGLLNKIIVLPSILMGLIASSLISSRWLDILV